MTRSPFDIALYCSRLLQHDRQAMADVWSDDIIVDRVHGHDDRIAHRIRGREAAVAQFCGLIDMLDDFSFSRARLYVGRDDEVICGFDYSVKFGRNRRHFKNIVLCHIEDGKINYMREYMDPVKIRTVMSCFSSMELLPLQQDVGRVAPETVSAVPRLSR